MELNTVEVLFLHRGGKWFAVEALGDGAGVNRHRIAVDEIEPALLLNAAKQVVSRLRVTRFQPIWGSGSPRSCICKTG